MAEKLENSIVVPETLSFDPEAAVDTLLLVRNVPAEVLGALKISVSADGKNIHLGPLEIPKQRVESYGRHILDSELNLDFLQELWDAGKDPSNYAIWHSHVFMSAFQSGTDVHTALEQLRLLLEIKMLTLEEPEDETVIGPYMALVFNMLGSVSACMYFLQKSAGFLGGPAGRYKFWDGYGYEYWDERNPLLKVKRIDFFQAEEAFLKAIASVPKDLFEQRKEVIGRIFKEKIVYDSPYIRRGMAKLFEEADRHYYYCRCDTCSLKRKFRERPLVRSPLDDYKIWCLS